MRSPSLPLPNLRIAASVIALAIGLPMALTSAPAQAQAQAAKSKPNDQPAEITADQIHHDRDLNTVTAKGHVEVDQAGRILLADNLSYNLKQDVIIATGNVSLTEADGQVTFANYIELTGDMKDAAIRGIRILMIDDSTMTGKDGRRIGGTRTVLNEATYTACRPCAEHPDDPPLWQVKARKVTHDEPEHLIEYEDSWFEFAGVPVFYTPYFSHADPTIKRKSGLLPMGMINNSALGNAIRTPYFQVVDEHEDITFAPMITTKQGEQLDVTDRTRSLHGESKTNFSVANMTSAGEGGKETTGWHVDARAQFDLNDTWRAGYQVQRAANQDYLSMYGYRPTKPYLTTNPYLQGFGYKSYASLEGYSFQNLAKSSTYNYTDPLTRSQPVVLPLGTYSFVGDPSSHGGYWSFDTHAAAVSREHGTSSQRLNTLTAWHLPSTTSDGQVIDFSSSLRVDGYNSTNVTSNTSGQDDSGRVQPQIAVDWRYPLTKVGATSSQTLTPIVVGAVSPYGGNSVKIPNEDSLDFELDDVNIFNPSPYYGYDRVFSGPRVAYGGEYTVNTRGLPAADVLLGQSYQAHADQNYQPGAGMDQHLSDLVGRVSTMPSTNAKFSYRFRMDKDDHTLRRSEISSNLGPKALNLVTSYVFFDKLSANSPYNAREQLSTTLSSQMSRYWSAQFYNVENLGSDAGPLSTGARLIYDDECLQVKLDGGSRHINATNFISGHYLMLNFVFKTLTQVPVNVF